MSEDLNPGGGGGGGGGGRVEPAPGPVRSEGIDLDEDLQKNAATQLADTRKAAETWRNGLFTGLFALLASVVFVKGPESFGDFDPFWGWVILALTAGALLVGAIGVGLLLSAAAGIPDVLSRQEFVAQGGLEGVRLQKMRSAVSSLRLGRIAAFGTFALAALALVATLIGTEAPKPVQARVTLSAGEVICGALKTGRVGEIKVATGGVDRIVLLAEAEAVEFVSKC